MDMYIRPCAYGRVCIRRKSGIVIKNLPRKVAKDTLYQYQSLDMRPQWNLLMKRYKKL
jgi:hypothetical protein